MAHNHAKVFFLKAYFKVYQFDIVCVFKEFLDSSIASDDCNLEILGYDLIRSDHLSTNKHGGICICYKSVLNLRVLNIYNSH